MSSEPLAHLVGMAAEHIRDSAAEVASCMTRPSVLYRPALYPDGNMWCALYGENIQEGLAGFGETPDAAMRAFDSAWHNEKCGRGKSC